MDFGSILGGGGGRNESAQGGAGQIGGAGRGASGAATIFGDKIRGDNSTLAIVGALAGFALVGLMVFLIVRSK